MAFSLIPMQPMKSLEGVANGTLKDWGLLSNVGYKGDLHPMVAHAWRMLTIVAFFEGIPLTYSFGGTIRTYSEQLNLFLSRYTPTYSWRINTTADRRTFEGRTWYKLKNVAAAASPGTSPHGWGRAVDTAIGQGPQGALSIGTDPDGSGPATTGFEFLKRHSEEFAYTWSLASEPWHIQWIHGDKLLPNLIPQNLPVIRPGDTPDPFYVYYLQAVLRVKMSQVWMYQNGIYDSPTEAAVRNVQAFFGKTVDGVVGPQTWDVINFGAVV